MNAARCGIVAVAAALTFVAQGAAQSGRQFTLQVGGGGMSALSNIAPAGTYTTKAGASFDGGLGVQLDRHVILKADVLYGSTALSLQGAPLGVDMHSTFISGLFEFPLQMGAWSPYLLAGGGALILRQQNGPNPKQTLGQATGGAGVAYRVGKTAASLFAEGRLYLNQPKGLYGNASGESRVQWDGALNAGLSYHFGHHG